MSDEVQALQSLQDLQMQTVRHDEDDILNQLVETDDPEKIRELSYLFQIHQAKQNMIRTGKLNNLLDKATNQALTRIEKAPDNFTNLELIQYIQAAQGAIERSSQQVKEATDAQVPVTLIQNNISVNIDKEALDSTERNRVLDIVQKILQEQKESENSKEAFEATFEDKT